MDLMTRVLDAYQASSPTPLATSPHGDGLLLYLPREFADGHAIAVLVHELDDGVFAVTDRGTTSAILAMADIDLDREHIRPIWDAICASVGRPVPPGVEPEDFQIAVIADANDLAGTVMAVESAMLRAETLRWTIPTPGR